MELVFVVSFANGGWWWHLSSSDPHGSILAHSDHGYPSEDECRKAIEVVKSCWRAPIRLRPRERNDHP
ncbi:MAG: hypothetical protein ACREJO_13410 [Phycisphaerales bacterium]